MNSTVNIHRLSTGVPGLDEVLGGGLPEYSFNVIAGPPGCGKTTLANQMMFALATPDRPALYLTVLGEPPLKMLRYQQQFGFFRSDDVGQNIHFISLMDDIVAGDLSQVLGRIADEVKALQPGFVFVDSFRSVALSGNPQVDSQGLMQQFVQQLGVLMTSWQATTFLIGEYFNELDTNPVFTVADGLIWLRQSVERNTMVRKLEIMKMRGQATLPGLHTFRINASGLRVFAPARERVRGDAETAAVAQVRHADRVAMGTAGLDEMLGGGLPRGQSLLVAGPTGSGKSVLAAAFLAEGARRGEKGVIATFEQQPWRSKDRTLANLIDSGDVAHVDSHAPDLSIDEVLQLLLLEIKRVDAVRVVIDSLSGFELAIAPTFRDNFRENLARLVGVLSAEGVTLLMTSELEDRYTDLRFSPYGTAFLTDAIIVQRYIEVESRLRRVLAVVKVRGSNHSNELREYTVGRDGLEIGAALVDLEGLLGGRPSFKRDRAALNARTPVDGG